MQAQNFLTLVVEQSPFANTKSDAQAHNKRNVALTRNGTDDKKPV